MKETIKNELEKLKKAKMYGRSGLDHLEKDEEIDQNYAGYQEDDDGGIEDFVVDVNPRKKILTNEVEDDEDQQRDKFAGPLMRSFRSGQQNPKSKPQQKKIDQKLDAETKELMDELLAQELNNLTAQPTERRRPRQTPNFFRPQEERQVVAGSRTFSNLVEESDPNNNSELNLDEDMKVELDRILSVNGSEDQSKSQNLPGSGSLHQQTTQETRQFSQNQTQSTYPNNRARSQPNQEFNHSKDELKPLDKGLLQYRKIRRMPNLILTANEPKNPFQAKKAIEEDEEHGMRVYWIDMEQNSKDRSMVHIFGRVQDKGEQTHSSICLTVKNNQRNVYIFKREDTDKETFSIDEVEKEIREILDSNSQMRGNYQITQVKKKYAFELDIARGTSLDCLEVSYSFKLPELRIKQEGRNYKGVIGNTYTPIELILLKLHIYGPCWLNVYSYIETNPNKKLSYCTHEYEIESLDDIVLNSKTDEEKLSAPFLKAVAVSIRTDDDKEKNFGKRITSIAMIEIEDLDIEKPSRKDKYNGLMYCLNPEPEVYQSIHLQSKAKHELLPTIKVFDDEKTMITTFVQHFNRIDPDLIISHDAYYSFWDVLISRLEKLRIDVLSSLSRLRRDYKEMTAKFKEFRTRKARAFSYGRLTCDTFLTSKEVLKEVEYSLSYLSKKLFTDDHYQPEIQVTGSTFNQLLLSVDNAFHAAHLSYQISKKLETIQLTKQLTNVAGCLWVQSLENQRASRNEMLLMHIFSRYNYIVPDKFRMQSDFENGKAKKKKGKNKYKGGYVLEPKSNLYNDAILLVDFNSLYPSIIREYDICFTTVKREFVDQSFYLNEEAREKFEMMYKEPEEVASVHNNRNIDKNKSDVCILPKIVKNLINKRKKIKSLLKIEKELNKRATLEIQQLAYKLIANSIYGCLGFGSSRFYARPLAALVTYYGRDILKKSAEKVESMNYEVVYGDTDSLMVNTRTNDIFQAIEIGVTIKTEINRQYRKKILEIEIDGIFKTLLLHKKKKYAARCVSNFGALIASLRSKKTDIAPEYSLEIKGLDMVRRDWCGLMKEVGRKVLEYLLSDNSIEEKCSNIYTYMEIIGNKLKQKKIPTHQFVIYKELKKLPKQYKDASSQPHVKVAEKLMKNKNYNPEQLLNHSIPFIICKICFISLGEGVNTTSAADRACHPEELKENGSLRIDTEYYALNQIFNPISRILEHFKEINLQRVGESLHIEKKNIKISQPIESEDEETEEFTEGHEFDFLKNYETIKVKSKGNEILFDPFRWYKQIVKKLHSETIWFETLRSKDKLPDSLNQDLAVRLKNGYNSALSRVIKKFYSSSFGLTCNQCKKELRGISIVQSEEGECFQENEEEYCSDTKLKTTSYFANKNIEFLRSLALKLEDYLGGDDSEKMLRDTEILKRNIKFGDINFQQIYKGCHDYKNMMVQSRRHYVVMQKSLRG